jgi:hypothetical protein
LFWNRLLALAATTGLSRFAVDDLSSGVHTNAAAFVEQSAQLLAAALNPGFCAGQRDSQRIRCRLLGEAFEFRERERLAIGRRQAPN